MGNHWFDWTVLFAFVLVFMYLGNRGRTTVVEANDDESGFLVAGRSLGPFVGACSLLATGYSGWGFLGSPGVAYHYGTIEVLANFFFCPAIVLATLFFAKSLRNRADSLGVCTIPEYIAMQHTTDEKWHRMLQGTAAIITVVLLLVFLTSQLKAIGLLISSWLGIPVAIAACMMICIIMTYATMGGLAAVAWSDTVMMCGMVFASIVVAVQIFGDVSIGELFSQLDRIDPSLINPVSGAPYGKFKAAPFLELPYAFLFAAVLPYMSIRFMAMKPDIKWHRVAAYAAPLGCILSIVPIVGVYMRYKMPGLEVADQAMPVYLKTFIHPALATFLTLFILFAMQSTATSLLQSVSSSVSYDLRKAMGKELSAKKALFINRVTIVIFGIAAFAMMFVPFSFVSWLGILGTGTLQATLIGPVFISSIWKGNAWGTMSAMLGGFCTSAYLMIFSDLGWIVSPLLGSCTATILYVTVSTLSFARQPRLGEKSPEHIPNGKLPAGQVAD